MSAPPSTENHESDLARFDHIVKLVMVGNSNVGKTTLLKALINEPGHDAQTSTIGVDFDIMYARTRDGTVVKMQVWDTGGQERFRSVTAGYYRQAHAAILMYDITDRVSFNVVYEWHRAFKDAALPDSRVVLVGNKVDLASKREVSTLSGSAMASKMQGCDSRDFFETSAKFKVNINEVFERVVEETVEALRRRGANPPPLTADSASAAGAVDLGAGGGDGGGRGGCCT